MEKSKKAASMTGDSKDRKELCLSKREWGEQGVAKESIIVY